MIKLLIGGSPCTYWSVAQKKGREVEAKGLGWELFKNYLIAKEKFKPDLFLYENNKSAAQPIKDQISRELDLCRERQPEVEYYNNEYLVLLAADTVRETEFSDFTLADYAAKMAARATS